MSNKKTNKRIPITKKLYSLRQYNKAENTIIRRNCFIHSTFNQFGWLFTIIICLILGYMFIWQRGMFLDDYGLGKFTVNISNGKQQFLTNLSQRPNFPARILSWIIVPPLVALLPNHELVARTIIAIVVGFNAFLLGWLVKRILGSRFAGIVSGWFFVMPIFTDVPLWISAADYLFCVTCVLICLHTFWCALIYHKNYFQWSILTLLIFVLSLSFKELSASSIGLVLFLGIIAIAQDFPKINYYRIRNVIILILLMILVLSGYIFIIYHSTVVTGREGFTTDIFTITQHAKIFLKQFITWTIGADWGRPIIIEGFKNGASRVIESRWGIILLCISITIIILTVLLWYDNDIRIKKHTDYSIGVLVIFNGYLWAIVTLLFPYVFINSQTYFERRFLYIPTAGIAIATGGICWIISRIIKPHITEKVILGITGFLLLLSSICMIGQAQAYQERNILDRMQIMALTQTLSYQYLPQDAQIVLVNIEEPPLGGKGLFGILTGVLESSWSACGAFEAAYQHNNFQLIVANRWAPLRFSYTKEEKDSDGYLDCSYSRSHYQPNKNDGILKLYAQGRYIETDKAALITYQNDKAFIIQSLTITDSDGMKHLISFPIAHSLKLKGLPILDNVVVLNQSLELGSPDGWG